MINPNVNRQILKRFDEFLNLLILMQQIMKLQRWNFRENYKFARFERMNKNNITRK
uniref:Uncharacterized protein n=1 Tax=Rhizophagus irregularis (strain DAOM 181602 / DAOM 197198 / MUCL 43194) TaxID=747089 RepID=U9SQQ3_RHIID